MRLNAGSYNVVINTSSLTTIQDGATVEQVDVNGINGNDFRINAGGTLRLSAYHSHPRTITMAGGLLTGTGSGKYNNDDCQLDGTTFTVTGSAPSTINFPNGMSLRYAPTFNVADVTGDAAPDLLVTGTGSIHNYDAGASSFTKSGVGTMQLANTNTYTGTTTVSAGTLQVDGVISTNTVTVQNGASLSGNGVIRGPVTVQAGGTLSPGALGIGRLTVSNNLTLSGKVLMELARLGAVLTNDSVAVSSRLSAAGSLVVTNIGTNALALGDSFKLFSAGTFAGGFTGFTLPALATNLTWDASNVTTNGTITIVAAPVPTNPPSITPVLTGFGFAIEWRLHA